MFFFIGLSPCAGRDSSAQWRPMSRFSPRNVLSKKFMVKKDVRPPCCPQSLSPATPHAGQRISTCDPPCWSTLFSPVTLDAGQRISHPVNSSPTPGCVLYQLQSSLESINLFSHHHYPLLVHPSPRDAAHGGTQGDPPISAGPPRVCTT